MSTFIVASLLVIAVAICIHKMIKDHRSGHGCSDCSGCSKAKQCQHKK
ncbi:MAG: FeoB-associated Cys-rich membrane protein [Beduini sp.]